MEIILKKTNITSTILNQVQPATIDDMVNSDVIGWCIDKGGLKKILFYNQSNNSLSWYVYFSEVKPIDDTTFDVSYKTPRGNTYHQKYNYQHKDTFADMYTFFNNIKQEAESKGQFFL